MKDDLVCEMSDFDLEHVHAGATAKGMANQTCGYLRKGAAACESLGLGDGDSPAKAKRTKSRK